ncbi:hypothetical protein BJ508DRAFT_67435 [Ascobolus immersus RN42]|uniref:Uncharacterized protein n=1 Tax=Ascobolus immersus RN42 TaxID=1160509 RepID=A0A3N4HLW9_ASCIM|nr:hypothetical protein BJ508DRAFT_67435 [Ascobolus immersus RN42]
MPLAIPGISFKTIAMAAVLWLAVTATPDTPQDPNEASRTGDYFKSFQLITRANAPRKCTELFEHKTIQSYGSQAEIQNYDTRNLERLIRRKPLTDIDTICDLKELKLKTSMSLAEEASKGAKEYFDEKQKEFGDIVPETRGNNAEIYIEIMCETSKASPVYSDVKKLRRKQNQRKDSAGQCKGFPVYDRNPRQCKRMNKSGNARSHMCSAPEKPQKDDKDDRKLFEIAEQKLAGIHHDDSCWYRENVLPGLLLKHCTSTIDGEVRVGGIVRFASWVNRAVNTNDNPKYSLIWVLDLKIFSCERDRDC